MRRASLSHLVVLFTFVFFALLPATAYSVTVGEIVALSKAGISDEVILALIERDKNVFALDLDQLVALKNGGVSETVILAMLKSGRQEPLTAPGADALSSAPSATTLEPNIIIVGHGPDRPNTYHEYDNFPAYRALPYPYFVPVPVLTIGLPVSTCGPRQLGSFCARVDTTPAPFGRFMNDPSARFLADGSQRFLNNGSSLAAPVQSPSKTDHQRRR